MSDSSAKLKQEIGLFSAAMLGLGSIIGTGVFVSIAIATGVTGPSVVLAIGVAALVAMCNAFSAAQLAAAHPVSGGTYEYGYRFLNPTFGFTAGWMFLLAKSASAATAALGFAGYLSHLLGLDAALIIPIAASTVAIMTVIVLTGLRRSNIVNTAIVAITLIALAALVIVGLSSVGEELGAKFEPFFKKATESPMHSFLYASALMFVAFTGYGRIATLGEEVREPRKTIPKAIVATLIVSALLYVAVAITAIGILGAEDFAAASVGAAAPLELAAAALDKPWLALLVAIGAMTAMLGVLLNLILGLSRVLMAMGRRRDMPSGVAKLNKSQTTPWIAVIVICLFVLGLTFFGSVKTTWSFSAFTVLVYYSITNLAALKLKREALIYPRIFSWLGLVSCLFLAFWVDWEIWASGLGLIALGLLWKLTRRSSA